MPYKVKTGRLWFAVVSTRGRAAPLLCISPLPCRQHPSFTLPFRRTQFGAVASPGSQAIAEFHRFLSSPASEQTTWRGPLPSAKLIPAANRLLAKLPRKDSQRFLDDCELVELAFNEVLAEPGARVRQVYFPVGALISVITVIKDSPSLEVGLVGDEGMCGSCLVLGVETSPQYRLVQGAGRALRMKATAFRRQLELSTALRRILNRYLHVLMCQLAQAAACTRYHLVEARLARWLLMTQDRAHSSKFHITHEFLAHTLGVRRTGITEAATALHNRQFINYYRGNIAILDTHGLETAACGCYAADLATYARVMK